MNARLTFHTSSSIPVFHSCNYRREDVKILVNDPLQLKLGHFRKKADVYHVDARYVEQHRYTCHAN